MKASTSTCVTLFFKILFSYLYLIIQGGVFFLLWHSVSGYEWAKAFGEWAFDSLRASFSLTHSPTSGEIGVCSNLPLWLPKTLCTSTTNKWSIIIRWTPEFMLSSNLEYALLIFSSIALAWPGLVKNGKNQGRLTTRLSEASRPTSLGWVGDGKFPKLEPVRHFLYHFLSHIFVIISKPILDRFGRYQ